MKKLFALILSIFTVSSVFAVDIAFKLTPGAALPLVDSAKDKKGVGFGAQAQVGLNFFNFLTAGLDGGLYMETINEADNPARYLSGGLGVGMFFSPFSRISIELGGGAGLYSYNFDADEFEKPVNYSDLYYKGYAEIGFRVNPSMTVSLNGTYTSYQIGCSKTDSGVLSAGISFKFASELGKKNAGHFTTSIIQENAVYPLCSSIYRETPFATLVLKNNETTEIRNVKISFRAGKYTASTIECRHFKTINKNKTVEIPLIADFSSELLTFNEDGKIPCEIIIDYSLLGKKMQSVQNVTISVDNKNSFYWSDPVSLSAFVSSSTNEILELAKYIAGIARNKLYTGMNPNIQYAAAMVEGLRALGITCSNDKLTPYTQYHNGSEKDSVLFPLQTVDCLSGDYDDLGILLASCLESVDVRCAFIPLTDDFLVLVGLGMNPSSAANHFADTNLLICSEDEVYLPLSMAQFENGFTASRIAGGMANLDEGEFIDIREGWSTYPAVNYTGFGNSYEKPSQEIIEQDFVKAVQEYIESDLAPIIENLKAASASPNAIGVALVRAGRYEDAIIKFKEGASRGSVSCMNNEANVYQIQMKYSDAAAMYKKVLKIAPENEVAKSGLERVSAMLED